MPAVAAPVITPVPTLPQVWPGSYPDTDPERRANPEILCPAQREKVATRIKREMAPA